MTEKLIDAIGLALWGPGWPQQMAAALGIDERTCRRWRDGSMTVPDSVYIDLAELIWRRERDLMNLRHAAGRKAAGLPEPVERE